MGRWAIGALLMCVAGVACAADPLFGKYNYGAAQRGIGEKQGFAPCLESTGATVRCKENVEYAGARFRLALTFNQQKLVDASLYGEYSDANYRRVLQQVAKTYMLVAIADDKNVVDVLAHTLNPNRTEADAKAIGDFETHALRNGSITYRLYEQLDQYIKPGLSAQQVLGSLPANIRVAEVTVKRDKDGNLLIVKFARPGLSSKKTRP
ncbi:hypothetical protein [Pseudomonas sp. GCEP-101]|uniref:hypothetical protein n=1 Tax=Pseudomonas sp. GCEP-101 TaxID=2974552 RepID=UPI00223B9283|nr:hypothetical protein [Pseudomonas sp. GCEP-101]